MLVHTAFSRRRLTTVPCTNHIHPVLSPQQGTSAPNACAAVWRALWNACVGMQCGRGHALHACTPSLSLFEWRITENKKYNCLREYIKPFVEHTHTDARVCTGDNTEAPSSPSSSSPQEAEMNYGQTEATALCQWQHEQNNKTAASRNDRVCRSHQHQHHPTISDSSILRVKRANTTSSAWILSLIQCMACTRAYVYACVLACVFVFLSCAQSSGSLTLLRSSLTILESQTIKTTWERHTADSFACHGVTLTLHIYCWLLSMRAIVVLFFRSFWFSPILKPEQSDKHTVETGLRTVSKCSFTTPLNAIDWQITLAPWFANHI